MFNKPRKCISEDTFIPKPQRVITIIHLCFALTLLLWYCSYPFLGEYYNDKSEILIYETVMGNVSELHMQKMHASSAKIERNRIRFLQLPIELQDALTQKLHTKLAKVNLPFIKKMRYVIHLFLYEIPPLELGWIFFSIMLSIFILKKKEGVAEVVWILPLICMCCFFFGENHVPYFSKESLFPSEEVIIEKYLKQPLKGSTSEQMKLLTHGWHLYLITEWAQLSPSENQEEFLSQVETGEFYFYLNMVKHFPETNGLRGASSFLKLVYYLIWNVFFAMMVNRPSMKLALVRNS